MNNRQKADAEEMRQDLFGAATWHCVVCGGPLAVHGSAQLAHRVPKHKGLLQKWGSDVINHAINLIPVCSLKCNDRVSLGTVRNEAKALLERIVRINTGRESMPNMTEYYRSVGKEFMDNGR